MPNRLGEYEDDAVKRTLESSFCPALIREARDAQDAILRERFLGKPLAIADIGCGDGYHGVLFGPTCRLYHGYEISPELAERARSRWREAGLDNAVVLEGDAAEAAPQGSVYDLVLCLYFTAGNFRDPADDLAFYTDAYLDRNPRFVQVVSRFYQALVSGGSFWMTVYRDVPEAEAAQREFYERTGQHVVTAPGSRFVATRENFWSVRFSETSLHSNLGASGVSTDAVVLYELNPIAWLVEIRK